MNTSVTATASATKADAPDMVERASTMTSALADTPSPLPASSRAPARTSVVAVLATVTCATVPPLEKIDGRLSPEKNPLRPFVNRFSNAEPKFWPEEPVANADTTVTAPEATIWLRPASSTAPLPITVEAAVSMSAMALVALPLPTEISPAALPIASTSAELYAPDTTTRSFAASIVDPPATRVVTETSDVASASAPSSMPATSEPAEPVARAASASCTPAPVSSMLYRASTLALRPAATAPASVALTVTSSVAVADDEPTPIPPAVVPVASAPARTRARAEISTSCPPLSCVPIPAMASTCRVTSASLSAPAPPSTPPDVAVAVACALSSECAAIDTSRPARMAAPASTRACALPPILASARLAPTASPPKEPPPVFAVALFVARMAMRASCPACTRAPLPT